MCAISVIHDQAKQWAPQVWDRPFFDNYSEVIRRLEAIDKKLGLPECDPNKAEFLKEIEGRLRRLEGIAGVTEGE